MIAQGREGAVRLGAAPAAPPPLGRDRVPGGARATPCPGLTRDGVGVVVPGLLGDVEDAGGHCPCPAWQFAVGTVSGDPSGQGSAGVTQPCIAKHSLALGPPFPPQEPHLLPRALTSTPGCPQGPSPAPQDPDLHPSTSPRRHCQLLSTCICIPTLSCAPLDTPRDTCKPPQDPQPCPRHPPLHSGITPGTLTCTSGPTPAPHNTLRDPIASPGPFPVPHQRPLPAPQHIHLYTRTPWGSVPTPHLHPSAPIPSSGSHLLPRHPDPFSKKYPPFILDPHPFPRAKPLDVPVPSQHPGRIGLPAESGGGF